MRFQYNILLCSFLLIVSCENKENLIYFDNSLLPINSTSNINIHKLLPDLLTVYINGDCHTCINTIDNLNKFYNKNILVIIYTRDNLLFNETTLPKLNLVFPTYIDTSLLFHTQNNITFYDNSNHYIITKYGEIVYNTNDLDKYIKSFLQTTDKINN